MSDKNSPKGELLDLDDGPTIFLYVDEMPIEGTRTKLTHPYSYDPILQWKSGTPHQHVVYTDRLNTWYGYERVQQLKLKHFGNIGDSWNNRRPKAIEEFLRELMNKPQLTVHRIEEHCNQASGYPVWLLGYNDVTEQGI